MTETPTTTPTTKDHGFHACGREGCRQRRSTKSKYCSHECATRDRWQGYQHRSKRHSNKRSISVSAETYEELTKMAEARGVSRSEVVEAMLGSILDRWEAASAGDRTPSEALTDD